jgi:hypothetical protein
MMPTRIYESQAESGYDKEDYESSFPGLVDCGWAASVEIIKVGEQEMVDMTPEEAALLQRFMSDPATAHHNTLVETLDVVGFHTGTVMKVRITHDVPSITSMGSDGGGSKYQNHFNGMPDPGPVFESDIPRYFFGMDENRMSFSDRYRSMGGTYNFGFVTNDEADALRHLFDGLL